jgi:hypothetical protein
LTRAYIEKFKELNERNIIGEIADFPGQPLSYLTERDEESIRQIMKFKIGDLWDQVFYSQQERGVRQLATQVDRSVFYSLSDS